MRRLVRELCGGSEEALKRIGRGSEEVLVLSLFHLRLPRAALRLLRLATYRSSVKHPKAGLR